MASIVLSPKAAESLRELPKDSLILKAIWRRLEEAAEDRSLLLPPAFPHPWPMLNFPAYDLSGQVWGVTVLVRNTPSDDPLTVVLIKASPLPPDLDPDDFFK
jgi:hypothetical protein